MHVGRGNEGREARDECEGLEDDGSHAALPGPLQVHDELAVAPPRQAVLRDRGSCHVTTDALQGGAIVGGDEHVSVEFEAAWAPSAQRFVGPFAALGFGSLLALDARELARRDFGALDEKCDIFQAGAGTGGASAAKPIERGVAAFRPCQYEPIVVGRCSGHVARRLRTASSRTQPSLSRTQPSVVGCRSHKNGADGCGRR